MKAVVHIHIGKELPDYFWKTITQTRRFYSGIIYLVIPEEYCSDSMVKKLECRVIPCENFENVPKIIRLREVSFLNKYGLGDFWHVTMQRLFVLEELIIREKISEVVHLENDVTIYFDPDVVFPKLRSCYKDAVAVVPLGPSEGCTAAVLYCSAVSSLTSITNRMIELLKLGEDKIMKFLPRSCMVHEMMLLGIIQGRVPNVLKTLPILPNKPSDNPIYGRTKIKAIRPIQKILDVIWPKRFHPPETFLLDNFVNELGGIFDPATLGQFLGGMPPPHKQRGTVIHKNHWLAPDLLLGRYSIVWHTDSKDRRCPYLKEKFGEEREWKIFNIHVHNKKIEDFV